MRTIKFLTDFFETQNLASKEENYDFIKEMNEHVKITIDGDEKQNMRGLKTNLHQFFWLMEFRRDPDKKIAIALFLKHYLEYLRKNIKHITVQEFLTIYDEIDLDAKYFDKEYVFGELITVVSDELK